MCRNLPERNSQDFQIEMIYSSLNLDNESIITLTVFAVIMQETEKGTPLARDALFHTMISSWKNE